MLVPKQVVSDSDSIPGRHFNLPATSDRLEIGSSAGFNENGARLHLGMQPGIILESRPLSLVTRTFWFDFLEGEIALSNGQGIRL